MRITFYLICISVAVPDQGSGAFLTPGSGMNIPDNISESLETSFGVKLKIFKFSDADIDGSTTFANKIRKLFINLDDRTQGSD